MGVTGIVFTNSPWWLETWFWLGIASWVWCFGVRWENYRWRGSTSWADTAFGLGSWFQDMPTWWKKYPTMTVVYFLGGPVWWLVGFFKVLVLPFIEFVLFPYVVIPFLKRVAKPAAEKISKVVDWLSK